MDSSRRATLVGSCNVKHINAIKVNIETPTMITAKKKNYIVQVTDLYRETEIRVKLDKIDTKSLKIEIKIRIVG